MCLSADSGERPDPEDDFGEGLGHISEKLSEVSRRILSDVEVDISANGCGKRLQIKPMTLTEGNVWVYETTAIDEATSFEFKPLRNGTDWSLGNNYWSRGGETIEVYPGF